MKPIESMTLQSEGSVTQRGRIHIDDRLGMAMFLAVSVHALVILGVGLTWESAPLESDNSMMEVTIAHVEADSPPEDADYLAEIDQDGGGVAEQPQIPSPLAGSPLPPAEALADEAAGSPATEQAERLITSVDSEQPAPSDTAEPSADAAEQEQHSEHDSAAAEFAQLQQRLSQPREPSKRFLNARTQAHEAAAYMEEWTRKVEGVGNLNYPNEARRRGLSGQLILEVTLQPDGSVDDVRIIQPSQYRILDEAAVRIVELGEPFAEVPDEVLNGHDKLVITRTWEFIDGKQLETH
ncbi:ferric siderophore transport system [Halorhodospira halochloris]|uniref:Ferric siderophore transport system n=1 Tax=Halorhodospira halochloris TaxID=1052 RepID=A0A110B6M3_HALHR|nr:energy transducer TonB [Halorhodospira halochloris]BAU56413.2 ferric siderophore transport system [Halorhodospira halochloris]